VGAARLATPVLRMVAVSLALALAGCNDEAAAPPAADATVAVAPVANTATANDDRAHLPIDEALSRYLADEKIRVIKLIGEDGEVTTFDTSGHELLQGETWHPGSGASMEPVPASATVAGETLGTCNVGGMLRTCHRRGFPNANKYHLDGRHAGTCACQ
jgi:hypothetical protein